MNALSQNLDSLDSLEKTNRDASILSFPPDSRCLEYLEPSGDFGVFGNAVFALVSLPLFAALWIQETLNRITFRQTVAWWLGRRPRPAWKYYCQTEECIRESNEWLARWRLDVERRNERQGLVGFYEI